MNNLGILVYTNETNLPILELFLNYFFKHNPILEYPIYIVSNKFTKSDLPYQDKVIYLSGNVEWDSQGKHFSQTLSNVLPQIKEEYIFYFCEDYILTDPIHASSLKNLIELMQDKNIDLFTFGSVYPVNHGWSLLNVECSKYSFKPDTFYQVDNQYKHAYNVQPSIWKKSSLQQLLIDNPKASLHDMDNSILKNKDHYKIICTNYKVYDMCCPPEYFIIGYKEIIRHGVFLMALNGHSISSENHNEIFIKQLIKENNIHNKPEYDKYIGFDKDLIVW